jgi:hypothetical protein
MEKLGPQKSQRLKTLACLAFLKSIFLMFNLALIAIGLALILVGVYGMHSFKDFFTLVPSANIYIAIICVGVFIIIVGMLSLCCAYKNLAWLLHLYSLVVFLLFLTIFTISILFVVKRDTVRFTLFLR